MPVSASSSAALTRRYGTLMQALVPELGGLVLWTGSSLKRRPAWGEAPEALDEALARSGWRQQVPAADGMMQCDIPSGPRALLLPLLTSTGRLLGVAALLWPRTARLEAAGLLQRLAPALDCLRQEVAANDAAARASQLQLQQMLGEMYVEGPEGADLQQLLEASMRRVGCEAAMVLAPSRGMVITAQAQPELSRDVAADWAGLRLMLLSLSGKLHRPLALNGPSARADRSSHCRVFIVPVRCAGGRVEALIAWLSPLSSATGGARQALLLRAGSEAVARRLDDDLDRATGLLNRNGLEAAYRQLSAGTGSLVLIDIDRHHAINAMHGYGAGDALIGQVAALLRPPLLPRGARVARLHGGCFAVLAPGVDARGATTSAQALQDAVGTLLSPQGEAEPLRATLSCGIAEIHDLGAPLERALVSAEVVLKLAKERGRSRIEVHVSENSTIIRRRDELFAAADLREALRTRQLVLFAQKIVSLRDPGLGHGYELLIRMRDAASGEIRSPKEFIDAAQRYQLLPAVDRYVVDSALEALGKHRALLVRQKVSMSINVSGQSIGDKEFIDHLLKRLRESKLPPGLITVEVTEQAAVTNLDRASEMMRRLREAGCGIALDDFGTGANSLAYLRALPATRIKIDGSFIRDILKNPRSEAAVRGIMQLAKDFRLESVAEYIESQAAADKLRRLGVDHGQGYFFGKPEPLEQALEALVREESVELAAILQLD